MLRKLEKVTLVTNICSAAVESTVHSYSGIEYFVHKIIWIIYICYVEEIKPPLWFSGQSSWLQIQRPGLDPRHHQIC
jgi:hypothetical protein